jgi:hypothetical protein
MTFEDFYEAVSHLCFDTDVSDYRDLFIDAMNRAFRQVTSVRPRMSFTTYNLASTDSEATKVNVRELVGDAYNRMPTNPVRDSIGLVVSNQQYTFLNKDTIMFLPSAKAGVYIIDYVMKSPKFDLDSFESDADVDIDDDLADAVVLLVAYYVLLGEDEDKAAAYLSRYYEKVSEIKQTVATHAPNGYTNANGW